MVRLEVVKWAISPVRIAVSDAEQRAIDVRIVRAGAAAPALVPFKNEVEHAEQPARDAIAGKNSRSMRVGSMRMFANSTAAVARSDRPIGQVVDVLPVAGSHRKDATM